MHSLVFPEFVESCVIWAPFTILIKNQILLRFPHYLELTYFYFLTQAHFHHFLHKKVNQWWDSKEGGKAVGCNLFLRQ